LARANRKKNRSQLALVQDGLGQRDRAQNTLHQAIIVSYLFGFESAGIYIVGEIPTGLPDFGIPEGLGFEELLAVAPGAIGVALVAFAESVAIARAYGTNRQNNLKWHN